MDSTIYKAVATVFVEGSSSNLIVPFLAALLGAGIGFLGSLLGAKKGAEAALDNSRKLEEEKMKKSGRSSLILIYSILSDFECTLKKVRDRIQAKIPFLSMVSFSIKHEYIREVLLINESVGRAVLSCVTILESYVDQTTMVKNAEPSIREELDKIDSPDAATISRVARKHYGEFDHQSSIIDKYKHYKESFDIIAKYYKDNIEPELNIT
ncbi:hypothetical protein K8R78_08780 [bacterium]|nr:hypothetical protein [bacterium]